MIAAMVKFEVKDEVKKQLADIEVAKDHISKVVEGCRKIPGLGEVIYNGSQNIRAGCFFDMGNAGAFRRLFKIGRI